MRVQRLRAVEDGRCSYTVLDGAGVPVGAVEDFLAHLAARGRSPNTVEGYAFDLRDFFVWLEQQDREFWELTLEQLAGFFAWLRRPVSARRPEVLGFLGSTSTAPATLLRKRAALASFYRFHARRDSRVTPMLGEQIGNRPTGGYVPMLVHTKRGRPDRDSLSPLRMRVPRRVPATLSEQQVTALQEACSRRRDRFLITLLVESGLRLGEALGLRHSDLNLRNATVDVVAREDDPDHARVKRGKDRTVPVRDEVLDLYADYTELEYGPRDADHVFVNLFREPVGSPLTAENVRGLVKRLRARSGVEFFTPHVARHTYATDLLRRGVAAHVVAELLGHASAQTTQSTYSHLTVEDHRAALQAAGVLDGATQ